MGENGVKIEAIYCYVFTSEITQKLSKTYQFHDHCVFLIDIFMTTKHTLRNSFIIQHKNAST